MDCFDIFTPSRGIEGDFPKTGRTFSFNLINLTQIKISKFIKFQINRFSELVNFQVNINYFILIHFLRKVQFIIVQL